MGLDLTLGGLVLLMGIRGWLKGFVLQAIRLAGIISCVYLADPVRDLAKPRVVGYLPTVPPDLVDPLLWWPSAIASYVVLVGFTSLVVKLARRKRLGDPEPYRNDQSAGFILGVAQGLVLAALATAVIEKYAMDHIRSVPFADQQARSSRALLWSERYQPVAKLWAIPAVQHFVNHVQRMGLTRSVEKPDSAPPVATADQPPKLEIGPADRAERDPTDFDPDITQKLESIREGVRRRDRPN